MFLESQCLICLFEIAALEKNFLENKEKLFRGFFKNVFDNLKQKNGRQAADTSRHFPAV